MKKSIPVLIGISLGLAGLISLYGGVKQSTTLYNSLPKDCKAYYKGDKEQSDAPSHCYEPAQPQSHNSDYLYGPYVPFIRKHKDTIVSAGQTYGVPPELIAGIIVNENYGKGDRYLLEDWQDSASIFWNKTAGPSLDFYIDASLGIGQINISTAKFLDEHYKKGDKTPIKLQKALTNTKKNIEYIAMNLGWLMGRKNRQLPEGTSCFDPIYVSIIGTEYVIGAKDTPLPPKDSSSGEGATPRVEGAIFARYVGQIPSINIFGKDATITRPEQMALRAFGEEAINQYRDTNDPVIRMALLDLK